MRQIDGTRIYSNFGPLARSLQSRLATRFGLPDENVVSVCNATVGLALSLVALQPKPGSLCAIPAWTFAATAHAVMQAGLIPFFIDVDPRTWALDPERVHDEIVRAPGNVTAVMPVAPFGQPIDVAVWDQFHDRTGLAVVIDAAAGFDSLVPGHVPSVVSLHATKVLGVGEGGCIASRNTDLINDLRARTNFGFFQSRDARVAATNAKLSEYHAAVGLAALDEWAAARKEWMSVADTYTRLFQGSNRIQLQSGFGSSWIASTCVVEIADGGADRVESALTTARIETRRWWGSGAHDHPATRQLPRSSLIATDTLARSTIGLPFYRDLELGAIERVVERVHAVA